MNPLQMAQQIKHELETVVWLEGTGEVVFGARGSVLVFAGTPPSEETIPPGFPIALVTIGTGTPDETHPDLLTQDFTIVLAAEVAGDPLGEFSVIGGARPDLGSSAGAGVAEVAERVRGAVQSLTGADGASILLSGSGTGAPASLGRGKHIAFEEYTLTALCMSQAYYAVPQHLGVTSSTWTWEGAHCSERFDFVRYRLGWASGTTPPSTPAGATIVYSGTAATTSHTPGTGRAYSVFADYDPRGTGATTHSSDGSVVGSYVTT